MKKRNLHVRNTREKNPFSVYSYEKEKKKATQQAHKSIGGTDQTRDFSEREKERGKRKKKI